MKNVFMSIIKLKTIELIILFVVFIILIMIAYCCLELKIQFITSYEKKNTFKKQKHKHSKDRYYVKTRQDTSW